MRSIDSVHSHHNQALKRNIVTYGCRYDYHLLGRLIRAAPLTQTLLSALDQPKCATVAPPRLLPRHVVILRHIDLLGLFSFLFIGPMRGPLHIDYVLADMLFRPFLESLRKFDLRVAWGTT